MIVYLGKAKNADEKLVNDIRNYLSQFFTVLEYQEGSIYSNRDLLRAQVVIYITGSQNYNDTYTIGKRLHGQLSDFAKKDFDLDDLFKNQFVVSSFDQSTSECNLYLDSVVDVGSIHGKDWSDYSTVITDGMAINMWNLEPFDVRDYQYITEVDPHQDTKIINRRMFLLLEK